MRKVIFLLSIFMFFFKTSASGNYEKKIYDFSIESITGETINFKEYKNKVILVVNTASYCGFTNQYRDLQKLWDKYGEDKLAVIGIASDSVNYKESPDNDQMRQVCRDRFGVMYPMMDKVVIGGQGQHLFFEWASSEGFKVIWNFKKLVINKDGEIVKRLGKKVEAMKGLNSVEKTVKKHL